MFADHAALTSQATVAIDMLVWLSKVKVRLEPRIKRKGNICWRLQRCRHHRSPPSCRTRNKVVQILGQTFWGNLFIAKLSIKISPNSSRATTCANSKSLCPAHRLTSDRASMSSALLCPSFWSYVSQLILHLSRL